MAREARKIRATSELAVALRDAERDGATVQLEANGATYALVPDAAGSAGEAHSRYDPEKLRAALRKYAGTISPEEADRMIAAIYRAREEGSRPADRP